MPMVTNDTPFLGDIQELLRIARRHDQSAITSAYERDTDRAVDLLNRGGTPRSPAVR